MILSARVELHRRTGRNGDKLFLEEQDGVAADLGYGDADDLMRAVSTAARSIAWVSDDLWNRVGASLEGPSGVASGSDRDVAPGVVLREGVVQLAVDADPTRRPAARAAGGGRRRPPRGPHRPGLAGPSGRRPARRHPVVPRGPGACSSSCSWPGRPAVHVVETLDQTGLWEPLLPEWADVRCRPQRNAYHRFTVDRHLCEAAANAAALVDRVERADLLVVGTPAARHRQGLPRRPHRRRHRGGRRASGPGWASTPHDTALLQQMVRHHLLLPDVATRRDLSDDGTIAHVAEAVGELRCLRLLDALCEADSIATGPAAWGSWKQELVGVLVDRVSHVLSGGSVEEVADSGFPTAEQLELMAQRRTIIEGADTTLVVVCPDRPGLFSRVAGVLSLHGLTVQEAAALTDDTDMAIEQFRVEGDFDREIPLGAHRAGPRAGARRPTRPRGPPGRAASAPTAGPRRLPGLVTHPEVIVDNDLSHTDTVLEVRAPDAMGVLWRITRALHDLDLDITSAKIQTLGTDAVDSFYVTDSAGRKVTDPSYLEEIERALLFALGDLGS